MTLRALCCLLVLWIAGCNDPDAPSPVRLVFGRTGVGPLEFNYPRAICIGPDQSVYIVDKAGRLQHISREGGFLNEWRMPLTAAGKPTGLGVDRAGRVYAADTHYASVKVFQADGTPAGAFGSYGDGPGQFRLPTDVAVAEDGTTYVSEYGGNDRVSVFDAAWRFVRQIPPAGAEYSFSRPQSVVIDRDGTLWVADMNNHRVCHVSPEGVMLGVFGKLGDGAGEYRFPYNVDLLSDGTLVVCEYGNNRVQRVSREGAGLGFWGRAGRQRGELAYPWALAVGQGDLVFVVDSGNNRVQAFDARRSGSWRKNSE